MNRWGMAFALTALCLIGNPDAASAHCQVPCGIYDDPARVQALLEDAATIRKAMKQASALAGKTDAQSVNQQIRWTMTKEAHAANVIEVVSTSPSPWASWAAAMISVAEAPSRRRASVARSASVGRGGVPVASGMGHIEDKPDRFSQQ